MALEYKWIADYALGRGELVGSLAQSLHDPEVLDPAEPPALRTSGMDVYILYVDTDDPNFGSELDHAAGFRRQTKVRFRMRSRASADDQGRAHRDMIAAILRFAKDHHGNGLLLHNGEYVILEHHGDDIVLNSDWNEEFDQPYYDDILAGYPRRRLAQPFM